MSVSCRHNIIHMGVGDILGSCAAPVQLIMTVRCMAQKSSSSSD